MYTSSTDQNQFITNDMKIICRCKDIMRTPVPLTRQNHILVPSPIMRQFGYPHLSPSRSSGRPKPSPGKRVKTKSAMKTKVPRIPAHISQQIKLAQQAHYYPLGYHSFSRSASAPSPSRLGGPKVAKKLKTKSAVNPYVSPRLRDIMHTIAHARRAHYRPLGYKSSSRSASR